MDFDFELLLVSLTAASGAIWALHRVFFAKAVTADIQSGKEAASEPVVVEYARSLFPVFFIVLLLRSFVAEPYEIPSGSMKPTLLVGDFIVVSKFSYGVRLPVIDTKLFDVDSPQRGDVMVFRYPRDNETNYIKRVVGLPGDHILYMNKMLYINNEPVSQETQAEVAGQCGGYKAIERVENLPGVAHRIYVCPQAPDRAYEFTVPEGQFLALGDNRDNSNDGRYWGYVPERNLVGRAKMIWFSSDASKGWFSGERIRWGRIGTSIK
ncbi:signal peptidase I [Sulfuriflexus mobilis]|uniref:signal peptidase I n=1 Tax=Sulfuriflexus mobilis TaxID=1811807 RepID=UPI000F8212A1|nr:signal peptidase I [Sulfuriflexus mobilis]